MELDGIPGAVTSRSDFALRHDLLVIARRLPAPCGHVLLLRAFHDAAVADIAKWLRRFRPLTDRHARRIVARTCALAAVLAGLSAAPLAPESEKSAWSMSALPPLETLLPDDTQ